MVPRLPDRRDEIGLLARSFDRMKQSLAIDPAGRYPDLEAFEDALAGLDHLTCFSVKANGNIHILKLLGEMGSGVDIVSGGELYRGLNAGFSPDRALLAGLMQEIGVLAVLRALAEHRNGTLDSGPRPPSELTIQDSRFASAVPLRRARADA